MPDSIIGKRIRFESHGEMAYGHVAAATHDGFYRVNWENGWIPSWAIASNCMVVPEEAVSAAPDQPPPVKNQHPAIQDLVTEDIAERKRVGIARYGTPLQPHNGRDALVNAYQESLDLTMYLRQAIYERDGR